METGYLTRRPDATLCYEFAVLGDSAGLPDDELRPALERAIALKPDFDDARYHLALVEKNSGHFEAAVAQFRAMRTIAPARAYNYWIAMDTLIESDRQAGAHRLPKRRRARSPKRRDRATQLAHIADTDLAVQFTMGKDGRVEIATTRVPHTTNDFNPFIEPSDKIRHAEGVLRQIDCSGPVTKFVVDTAAGTVTLTIADPVMFRCETRPEFTCGTQQATKVVVDYTEAEGIARGIQFKQ